MRENYRDTAETLFNKELLSWLWDIVLGLVCEKYSCISSTIAKTMKTCKYVLMRSGDTSLIVFNDGGRIEDKLLYKD